MRRSSLALLARGLALAVIFSACSSGAFQSKVGIQGTSPSVTMTRQKGAGMADESGKGEKISQGMNWPSADGKNGMVTEPDSSVKCVAQGRDCEGDPSPLRRLSTREYVNAVQSLLTTTLNPTETFPGDFIVDGFRNNAVVQVATPPVVEAYLNAAELLATDAIANLGRVLGCDAAAKGEEACYTKFIDTIARRAYRRPLTAEEKTVLRRVFDDGKQRSGGFAGGIRNALQAVLVAPQFLYRLETSKPANPPGSGNASIVRLNDFEVATRLSFFLWESIPDEALLAAAEKGELKTKEHVVGQARRMLADPKAKKTVAHFFEEWLELEELNSLTKDTTAFPQFTPDTAQLLRQELVTFLDHVFWQEKGKLHTLLLADYSFRNAKLATFYGDGGGSGETLTKTLLSDPNRRGFLTMAGYMAKLATPEKSNPITRGKFIRERLLCGHIPDPPPGVEGMAPPKKPDDTARESLALHTQVPGCDSCHRLMDSLGLGLENYDAVGLWRDKEKNKLIDASGNLPQEDGGATFDNPIEMAQALSKSPTVDGCIVKNWFRYGMGRSELTMDEPLLTELVANYRASEHDMQALVTDIVQSDAFLYRVQSK